ncbi:MAG: hypothetical protein J6C13_00410, partial [Clostridia bacterium]|nr:hypothetical protein [Clostridia bacterium]
MNKIPFNMDLDSVYKEYKSNKHGLDSKTAKNRLNENGANELTSAKKKSKLARFLGQFKDVMIIILLIASVVTAVIALIHQEYM